MNDRSGAGISPEKSRRGLLALIGAGGAAAVAALLGRSNGAHAGHGGGVDPDALHLGESNTAPPGGTTDLVGDSMPESEPVFSVQNLNAALGSVAIAGNSDDAGGGVRGGSANGIGVAGGSENGPGLSGNSVNGTGTEGHSQNGPGVQGDSQNGTGVSGNSESGPGVRGESGSGNGVEGFGQGGDGVFGESQSGWGLRGHSQSGPGVGGHSQTGNGVEGRSESSGAGGAFDGVDGPGVLGRSGAGPGVVGDSQGGVGVVGHGGIDVAPGEPGFGGAGVVGHGGIVPAPGGPGFGGAPGVVGVGGIDVAPPPGVTFGSGTGVDGGSESGYGVRGFSHSGVGVHGESKGEGQTGIGVVGSSLGDVPAVMAFSGDYSPAPWPVEGAESPDGGLALDVVGKARFSTAGAGSVAAGQSSATVANPAVTADSHITVTLNGDPGPRQLVWVEKDPGVGFTVHLTFAPPPQRPETAFTYLIVEPAA